MVQRLDQFRYISNGVPLSCVDEHKDLGVTIDIKLGFYSHAPMIFVTIGWQSLEVHCL